MRYQIVCDLPHRAERDPNTSLPMVTGPALDIQHSPVRVYLAHAGQPGQAGSDHPAEKQPKSLLKTQENGKANLLPEI